MSSSEVGEVAVFVPVLPAPLSCAIMLVKLEVRLFFFLMAALLRWLLLPPAALTVGLAVRWIAGGGAFGVLEPEPGFEPGAAACKLGAEFTLGKLLLGDTGALSTDSSEADVVFCGVSDLWPPRSPAKNISRCMTKQKICENVTIKNSVATF